MLSLCSCHFTSEVQWLMSLTTKSTFLTIRLSCHHSKLHTFPSIDFVNKWSGALKICCLHSEPDLRSVNIQGLDLPFWLVVFNGLAHPKMVHLLMSVQTCMHFFLLLNTNEDTLCVFVNTICQPLWISLYGYRLLICSSKYLLLEQHEGEYMR